MGFTARFILLAGVFSFAMIGISPAQAAEQKQAANQKQAATGTQTLEQWRYTFHNGEWWYWLPANRWVFWRDNRWNDYNPRTYTLPRSSIAVAPEQKLRSGNPAINDQDNRPFYGQTLGELDRRSTKANSEIGPFYGNPLPSDVFGPSRWRRGVRPFYGRAASSD